MVNSRKDFWAGCAVLVLAAVVLTATAAARGEEYDEQYTLFLTGADARPIWPQTIVLARDVVNIQHAQAGLASIATALRRTDVHPPLYFWAVAAWRRCIGGGLFEIRLLSVVFSLGALAAVGAIARRTGIAAAMAMVLTLGCYAFAYTGGIARGFALAQMFTLWGVWSVLAGRRFVAGTLLGAAVATNYLAAFVVAVAAIAASWPRPRNAVRIAAPLLPFVAMAGWFFVAQRGGRDAQFPPFDLWLAVARLAHYEAASLTGGLPLYVTEAARPLVSAILALGLASVAVLVARCRVRAGLLLTACALAPPLGLLVLGAVFGNTPIELRYLSFGTPFVALLIAAARPGPLILAAILTVQAASLAGLVSRPETMQPFAASARAAAAVVGDGAVLLPRGNDGVGIVGAFALSAPGSLPLLIVRPTDTQADIRTRIAPFHRIVLVLLGVDADSRTALPAMTAGLEAPGWRRLASGFNVVAYERTDDAE